MMNNNIVNEFEGDEAITVDPLVGLKSSPHESAVFVQHQLVAERRKTELAQAEAHAARAEAERANRALKEATEQLEQERQSADWAIERASEERDRALSDLREVYKYLTYSDIHTRASSVSTFVKASLKNFTPEEYSFSPNAYKALLEEINDYVTELTSGAIRLAQRRGSDTVAPTHVKDTSAFLVTKSRSRKSKIAGYVGALLMGAAIAFVSSILLGAVATPLILGATLLLTILGVFCSVYYFMYD